MADIDEAKGKQVATSLSNGTFVKTDLSNMDDVEALYNFAKSKYGHVDIMINNGGIGNGDMFFNDPNSTNSRGWQKMMRVNADAVIYGTQLAVRDAQKSGRKLVVINTSSVGALRPSNGAYVYVGSKAAVLHFSRSVGKFAGPNIRVVAICPAGVITPLWESLHDIPQFADEHRWRMMRQESSFLTPDDVADAMVRAVDDESLNAVALMIHGDGIIGLFLPSWKGGVDRCSPFCAASRCCCAHA